MSIPPEKKTTSDLVKLILQHKYGHSEEELDRVGMYGDQILIRTKTRIGSTEFHYVKDIMSASRILTST
jgi:hypothetical protein